MFARVGEITSLNLLGISRFRAFLCERTKSIRRALEPEEATVGRTTHATVDINELAYPIERRQLKASQRVVCCRRWQHSPQRRLPAQDRDDFVATSRSLSLGHWRRTAHVRDPDRVGFDTDSGFVTKNMAGTASCH